MTVFVIMPFGAEYDFIYKQIYKKVIESNGDNSIRSDEIYKTKPIIEKIFSLITNSDCLIADLSDRNPNVSYELGIAHSLSKPVILVASNINDIPFDYRHLQIILYDKSKDYQKELYGKILKALNSIKENRESNIIKFEFLELKQKAIRAFLLTSYKHFEGEVQKKSIYNIDSKGNATLTQLWKVTPYSDITHIIHHPFIDKPGFIKVVSIFDLNIREKLEYFVLEETPISKMYAILFNNLKENKKTFSFETKLVLENFISDLFEKGSAQVFHTNKRDSNLAYRDVEIIINFNVEDFAKNYTCEIESLNTKSKGLNLLNPIELNNTSFQYIFKSITNKKQKQNENIFTFKKIMR